jgi:ankyrin repeat protein
MSFYDAAVFADFVRVRSILAERSSAVKDRDEYGLTALHGVVGEEHVEMAQLLIDHGADVNVHSEDGATPLHLAAYPGMVDLLVRNGADINARNNDGETPLITHAMEPDGDEVVETLLRLGADVNARDKSGETALGHAKRRDETEIAAMLLRKGARL